MTLKDKRRRTKLKLREDEVNEQSGTHLTESACLQRHRGWKKEDLHIVEQRKTIGRFDADDQQRHRYPDPYHWHHCLSVVLVCGWSLFVVGHC